MPTKKVSAPEVKRKAYDHVRQQVAIGGKITYQRRAGVSPNVLIKATAGKKSYIATIKEHRFYYFCNLPEGRYSIEASIPGASFRYGTVSAEATVPKSREANDGAVEPQFVDLVVPASTIRGVVVIEPKTPAIMAQVRVKGSGEQTYTDNRGEYVLSAVEKGARTVQVFTPGRRDPQEKVARIKQAGTTVEVNFTLPS